MKLNTVELYKMQTVLNERILKQHNLTKEETKKARILAMLVELGELANETRCFKYWSEKGASAKEVVLEEYVDGIHFLLSIGIDEGDIFESIENKPLKEEDITLNFLEIYQEISQLAIQYTTEAYLHAFGIYLELGTKLAFSEQDMIEAYFEKNKENHIRQDQHY